MAEFQRKIKGILFDFDGTLARTMEDLLAAWQYAFRQYGVEIKKEDYFPLEGMNVFSIAKTMAEKYNLPIVNQDVVDQKEIVNIVRRKEDHYENHHSFSLYPGVVELITNLQQRGIKMGLVTASSRQKLEKTVPTEFLRKFLVIVPGEEAGRGKPFPDPYLIGLQKLGLEREECLVVENALLGVEAAKKAGLYCIAITSTVEKEKLYFADEVINHFEELPLTKKLKIAFNPSSLPD